MTRTGDANDDVEATRDQRRRDRAALQSSAAWRCRAAKAAALAALENMSAPSKAPLSADARPPRRGVAAHIKKQPIGLRIGGHAARVRSVGLDDRDVVVFPGKLSEFREFLVGLVDGEHVGSYRRGQRRGEHQRTAREKNGKCRRSLSRTGATMPRNLSGFMFEMYCRLLRGRVAASFGASSLFFILVGARHGQFNLLFSLLSNTRHVIVTFSSLSADMRLLSSVVFLPSALWDLRSSTFSPALVMLI